MTCSKCGGSKIETRFHAGSTYWGDALHCASGSSATSFASHRSDEHLHYRCETCRYDWTGDTAGAGNGHPQP